MKFNRVFLVKLHLVLAAFILPVALMFFITGALYTWGVKGNYDTQVYKIQLAQPMQENLGWLKQRVVNELTQRDTELPSGNAKIKKAGNSFYFEWTGTRLDTRLEPTKNPFIAKLKIKKTRWHRLFVQLHKAKGGDAFKVYAAVLAVCLVVLFITGCVLAWQLKKYRLLLMSSTFAGVIMFMLMVFVS